LRKIAFIFPGQGSQSVGMGRQFFERYDTAKKLFKRADEALGFSIQKLCFEGPAEELQKTFNTQPAILTVSVICGEILKEHGVQPDIAAGHSLGEYSALVTADVLDFEDAVALVNKRGAFMQQAVPLGEGSMAAVLGLEREKIVAVCEKISTEKGALVQAVNFNCPGQVVVAGTMQGVEKACTALVAAGAKRVIKLAVSAPFHSVLMQPAAEKLAAELDKVTIRDAKLPVVANVNGQIVQKAAEIKASLVAQAASPVKWEDCVAAMKRFGAEDYVEVGPGKVLTGFNKKIDRALRNCNVEDDVSLEKTLDYFKEVR